MVVALLYNHLCAKHKSDLANAHLLSPTAGYGNLTGLQMCRRRMYDQIIQCSPLLPSGVTLAEVLEGSSAADVKDIVASLPDSGTISAAAMITAGLPLRLLLRCSTGPCRVALPMPCIQEAGSSRMQLIMAPPLPCTLSTATIIASNKLDNAALH